MKLKDIISQHTKYWDCYNDAPLKYNHTDKVLKIIDHFSLNFYTWALIHKEKNPGMCATELLKIYKKEYNKTVKKI